MDHLVGVHDLLAEWENPLYVCAAGMFHSIYGTSSYTAITLPLSKRGNLINIIGSASERLVYLYCIADRTRLLQMVIAADHSRLSRIGSSEDEPINSIEYAQLLEILYADRVEQLPNRDPVTDNDLSRLHLSSRSLELWRLALPFLSAKAQRHIGLALGGNRDSEIDS